MQLHFLFLKTLKIVLSWKHQVKAWTALQTWLQPQCVRHINAASTRACPVVWRMRMSHRLWALNFGAALLWLTLLWLADVWGHSKEWSKICTVNCTVISMLLLKDFCPGHDSAFMRCSWKTVARLVKRNLRDFEKVSSLMTSCVKGNCVCLPVLVKIKTPPFWSRCKFASRGWYTYLGNVCALFEDY